MIDADWTFERVMEAARDARERGAVVKVAVGNSTYVFNGTADAAEVTDA